VSTETRKKCSKTTLPVSLDGKHAEPRITENRIGWAPVLLSAVKLVKTALIRLEVRGTLLSFKELYRFKRKSEGRYGLLLIPIGRSGPGLGTLVVKMRSDMVWSSFSTTTSHTWRSAGSPAAFTTSKEQILSGTIKNLGKVLQHMPHGGGGAPSPTHPP